MILVLAKILSGRYLCIKYDGNGGGKLPLIKDFLFGLHIILVSLYTPCKNQTKVFPIVLSELCKRIWAFDFKLNHHFSKYVFPQTYKSLFEIVVVQRVAAWMQSAVTNFHLVGGLTSYSCIGAPLVRARF